MRALSVSMSLREDTAVRPLAFVSDSAGRAPSSLQVGEDEFVVLGPPEEFRRLAWEAIAAAEDAERLDAIRVMSGASGRG